MFISIEGISGSGKTTLAGMLAKKLGGKVIKETINTDGNAYEQLIDVVNTRSKFQSYIKTSDQPVVIDRYIHSTYLYQVLKDGLDQRMVQKIMRRFVYPDFIFFLRCDPFIACEHTVSRGYRVALLSELKEEADYYSKIFPCQNSHTIERNNLPDMLQNMIDLMRINSA